MGKVRRNGANRSLFHAAKDSTVAPLFYRTRPTVGIVPLREAKRRLLADLAERGILKT